MVWILLFLIGWNANISVEGIGSIQIESKKKDVVLKVEEVSEITLNAEESALEVQELTGDRVKLVLKENSEITIPPLKKIEISTVSGDVDIIFNESLSVYPEFLDVETVNGDIYIKNIPPLFFNIASVTGDVDLKGYIKADSSLWNEAKGDIETVSGDVEMEPPLPCDIEFTTVSGDVTISGKAEKKVSYTFESVTGDISVPHEANVDVKITKLSEKYESCKESRSLFELIPSYGLDDWLLYNRVDGFALGASIDRKSENSRVTLGARYGFSSKRWSFWFRFTREIYSPLYLHASFHSGTVTPDRWKISSWENTFSAFLFNEDYMDYYRDKGMEAGPGIFFPGFNIRFLYGLYKFYSMEKKTDWSLFYSQKEMRENPEVMEGDYKFLKLESSSSFDEFLVHLSFMKAFETPSDDDLQRFFGEIIYKKSLGEDKLSLRLTGGYSTEEEFPFGFRIGGVGTLPGYELNEFQASKFALLQGNYWMKISGVNAIFFFDAAKIGNFKEPVKADFGLGISPLGGISLRIARNIEEKGDFKIFVRLARRF